MTRMTSLSLVFLCACGSLGQNTRASLHVSNMRQFADESLFQVSVVIKDEDGDVERWSGGNAFLVDTNVLVTNNHVVRKAAEPRAELFVVTPRGAVPARVMLSDATNDIAILEASVDGLVLPLREPNKDDLVLFVSGVWIYKHSGDIESYPYFHQVSVVPGSRSFFPPAPFTFAVQGIMVKGMSGSPVVASDGSVVGMVVYAVDACEGEEKGYPAQGQIINARSIITNLDHYRQKIRVKGKKSP